MKIATQAFGDIEIDEQRVIRMTEPIPGFLRLSRYVVLDPHPETPFKWLQCVEQPDVCFLIADPTAFFPDYRVELPETRLTDLELHEEDDATVAVIVTSRGDLTSMTANLLAPLVFNSRRGLGRQVILEGTLHPVRAPLFEQVAQAACQGG